MNNLFICSTPLQVIHAVNIVKNILEASDISTIYILDHHKSSVDLYEHISKQSLFTNVYFLKTSKFNTLYHQINSMNIVTRAINKFLMYTFLSLISKHFVNDSIVYDRFFTTSMDFSSWLIFLKLKRLNKNLKLSFFEDGLGSYTLLLKKPAKLDIVILRLFRFNHMFSYISELYVLEKRMIKGSYYPSVIVKELANYANISKELNQIFIDKNLSHYKLRYVFFDSPFPDNLVLKKQENVLKTIHNKLGDALQLKLHPRTRGFNIFFDNIVLKTHLPFEIINLNINLENKTLITILSTTVFTPKLIFNQEPNIIFLYKIVSVGHIVPKETFSLVDDLIQLYENKTKIYIPETLEELMIVLEKL